MNNTATDSLTISGLIEEVEELKSSIRNCRTLEDLRYLQRLVGPSPEEQELAKQRLEYLNQISDRCGWGKRVFQLSPQEQQARSQWHYFRENQSEYEARYC